MKSEKILPFLLIALFFFAVSMTPCPAFAQKSLGISTAARTVVSSGKIYEKPDAGSKAIGKVQKGQKVTVLMTYGDFVKIRTARGKVGYVQKSLVGLPGAGGLTSAGDDSDRTKDQTTIAKKKKKGVRKKEEPAATIQKPGEDREKRSMKKKPDSKSPAPDAMKKKEEARLKPKPAVPLVCLAGKGGIASPFGEVATAAVEGDLWYRLLHFGHAGIYATGAIGYIPLKPYIRLQSDDPDLEGFWVPGHVGLSLAWYGKQFRPYVGAGLGGHYYSAKIDPDNTRLDLDDEDDETDRHTIDPFGFGGRLLGGIGFAAGPGSFLLEGQLIGSTVEQNFVGAFVFFVGYRFCWN